jgi:ATP-dependent DNA ligase
MKLTNDFVQSGNILRFRNFEYFLSDLMVKRTETPAIEGATPATMPGFIKPQLATLRSKAPKGPQWLHEIKLDGYRVQVHLNKGKKKVFTPPGWTG